MQLNIVTKDNCEFFKFQKIDNYHVDHSEEIIPSIPNFIYIYIHLKFIAEEIIYMSDLNQRFQTIYPRSSKRRIVYKVLSQRDIRDIMQPDIVSTEINANLQGTDGGQEETELNMSKVNFEDFKERLSI